jgi:hypothetical protein
MPSGSGWARACGVAAAAALAVGAVACEEQSPVGVGGEEPSTPVTVEIELPWSEFGSNLQTFGGFGTTYELGEGLLATNFAGTLNARTLVRFGAYPATASVRDSSGTQQTDTDLTYVGGTLVAFFDTVASTNTGPVSLTLGALQQVWHARSATWTSAVDTLGDIQPWTEPGAGPVNEVSLTTWEPSVGDSALFALDSAAVAAWADTTDLSRGARIDAVTEGVRLRLLGASLRLSVRPSVRPDTLITLTTSTREVTFVYDPPAPMPSSEIRVGGAPSWRTVIDVTLPDQLTGPPELCALVACPHTIEAGELSYASLVMTSDSTTAAFQPSDSTSVDARPVLQSSALPKAPLGSSLLQLLFGQRFPADAFGSAPGQRLEVPVTGFVGDLLASEDAPRTVALLSPFEPSAISWASFVGPGVTGEPTLRLILTIGAAMELP